jgi:hypothetical protein
VAAKGVEAEAKEEITEAEHTSPSDAPFPEATKETAGGLSGSMWAPKVVEKEKPLSKLEAADVAERVGKEKWFKEPREKGKKSGEGVGTKEGDVDGDKESKIMPSPFGNNWKGPVS